MLINNAGLERLTPVERRQRRERGGLPAHHRDQRHRHLPRHARGAAAHGAAAARIVNTASIWGRVAEPLFSAYVASKHAVIGLTKTWAKELGPRGITVNAVAPGWVRTECVDALAQARWRSGAVPTEEELLADIVGHQALPGLMEPEDIAGPYLFLASDLAANITGQTLGIDRGEVPW